MATVLPSPNYTEASRKFQEDLLNLEPGTLNGGLYANKAGYHNKRQNLPLTDYSVRVLVDKQGPSDKSAGHDWTFPTAQAGDYTLITKYTRRISDAFWARDPRFKGWREVLGSIDGVTIGFDFDTWQTRKPDSTHKWHIHFSEHRAYVESSTNKQAMFEVVSGGQIDMIQGMLCQFGDKGAVVGALQRMLNVVEPANQIAEDDQYGPGTRDKLRRVMVTMNWNVDGTVFWRGEYERLLAAHTLFIVRTSGAGNGGGDNVLVPHTHNFSSLGSFTSSGVTGPAEAS